MRPEDRGVATGLLTLGQLLGSAVGTGLVAGLSGPLGLRGAVTALAALPAAAALGAPAAADRHRVPTPEHARRAA